MAEDIGLNGSSGSAAKRTETTCESTKEQPLMIDLDAMNAKLAAAGLDAPGDSEPTGHGLTIQKAGKAPDVIAH